MKIKVGSKHISVSPILLSRYKTKDALSKGLPKVLEHLNLGADEMKAVVDVASEGLKK